MILCPLFAIVLIAALAFLNRRQAREIQTIKEANASQALKIEDCRRAYHRSVEESSYERQKANNAGNRCIALETQNEGISRELANCHDTIRDLVESRDELRRQVQEVITNDRNADIPF
ncbi:hypothetical protein [Roseiconus lacunae]|uniref:hypothetical protein n=1 Tax=Roseiconus lacunae TaxID=2605694 RepID=UPI0011F36E87|nr:hypothetical protein [Roseiconus lacunae]